MNGAVRYVAAAAAGVIVAAPIALAGEKLLHTGENQSEICTQVDALRAGLSATIEESKLLSRTAKGRSASERSEAALFYNQLLNTLRPLPPC